MIGALFLAIPRTSLVISVYEREAVQYISDAHNMNQIDMMYHLFVSFLNPEESQDFDFDNGLVCRRFNGQAKIVAAFSEAKTRLTCGIIIVTKAYNVIAE